MRNPIGYLALSLLAAAFAGCSSTDTGSTQGNGSEPLVGQLAKYNASIKALTAACAFDATNGTATITIGSANGSTIADLSLRSVDSALLVNGVACTYTDTNSVVQTVTSKTLKILTVNGDAAADDTLILDIRNGIFAKGAITVNLSGNSGGTSKDEVAVLGADKADKIVCARDTTLSEDTLDLDADHTADVKLANVAHITVDLSAGDDTFDQGACQTTLSVYGGAGKDTITVGTLENTVGDVFSGGTDGTDAAESTDTITFAARSVVGTNHGVTVSLNESLTTIAGTGSDGYGTENDHVLNDFETVIGTPFGDTLTAGALIVGSKTAKNTVYVLNGGDGDDTLASMKGFPVTFNGGLGTDAVTYVGRNAGLPASGAGVKVVMDGATASGETNDGDKIGKDVENLVGTKLDDTITGNSAPNVITPGLGSDTVNGGDGDDTMVAEAAVDGADTFNGGNGSDTVDYHLRSASVCVYLDGTASGAGCTVQATHANCLATPSAGNCVTVVPTEADVIGKSLDVENIIGTPVADFLMGNALANIIIGNGDTGTVGDVIIGGAGNDTLDGTDTGAATCSTTTVISCGGDAMDVATCAGAASTRFLSCWKTQ